MVPYLLLALCLVVGFYLVGRWFVQADPKAVLKALGWTFGTIGVLAVLVIVAFKKFNLLIYTLPFLLPLMVRLPRLVRRLKTLRGAAPGGSSSVSTRFLRMELDHSTMTREEALAVLGLEPDAKDEDIRKAHRRLMQQLHPDHGGSNYLAAKVNAAKQQLLGS